MHVPEDKYITNANPDPHLDPHSNPHTDLHPSSLSWSDFVKGEWPRDFVKGRRGQMVERPYGGGEGGRRQGTKLPKLPKLTTHLCL